MANSRRWAFSNDFRLDPNATEATKLAFQTHRKRPLYMGEYVRRRQELGNNIPLEESVAQSINLMRDYTDADLNALNTYHELNLPELVTFKRAYRMNAIDDLIIVLDVEPDSSPDVINHLSKIPAHFSEWSTNNGLHMFYKLNMTDLTPEVKTLLSMAVKKIDDAKNGLRCKLELIMNDHWITFTGKTNVEQIVPLETPVPKAIHNIIQTIAQSATMQQQEIEKILVDANGTSETSDKVSNWLLASPKMIEIAQLTPDQFQNDMSKYEFNVIIRVAGYLNYQIANASPMTSYRLGGVNLTQMSDQDSIRAIYQAIKEVLPYRSKHDTYRDKLPWLLYQTVKAYEIVKSRSES